MERGKKLPSTYYRHGPIGRYHNILRRWAIRMGRKKAQQSKVIWGGGEENVFGILFSMTSRRTKQNSGASLLENLLPFPAPHLQDLLFSHLDLKSKSQLLRVSRAARRFVQERQERLVQKKSFLETIFRGKMS